MNPYDIEKSTQKILREVVGQGDLELLKSLLPKYSNIGFQNSGLFTDAVFCGNLEITKYLAEQKDIDIHTLSDYAIVIAAENGHLHVFKYLEALGLKVNAYGDQALVFAADMGHFHVVKYIVEKFNVHKNVLEECIFWAGESNHEEILNYLKEQKAKKRKKK